VTPGLKSAAQKLPCIVGSASTVCHRYLRRRCFTLMLLLLLLLQRNVMTCERWQGRGCSAPEYQTA
jgi:hypothetical protein